MKAKLKHQDLFSGLIRLHILHHAAEGEFYGQWMIHELARHGYTLSPGTLYPMLHGLERKGYLKSHKKRIGRTYRRFYRATPKGRKALVVVRARLGELFDEVARKKRRAAKKSNGSGADRPASGTDRRGTKHYRSDRPVA